MYLLDLCVVHFTSSFSSMMPQSRKDWVYPVKGKDDIYPTFNKCLTLVDLERA